MKKDNPCKGNQKRVGVAILISDKILSDAIGHKWQRRTLHSDKILIQSENIKL